MLRLVLCLAFLAGPAQAELPALPIDAEIERIKPRPSDSVEAADAKCARLATEASARGARVLLVGIEGQGGFQADNAWLVYRYLWRITHGMADSPPDLGTANPVLHRLLLPLIGAYNGGVELLNFPETAVGESAGGAPEACVARWMARTDQPKVAMIGHSFGGDAVHDLTHALAKRGILVHTAFSLDPVPRTNIRRMSKPANVAWWGNLVQRTGSPYGEIVYGANLSQDFTQYGANHRTIVRAPETMAAVKRRLGLTQSATGAGGAQNQEIFWRNSRRLQIWRAQGR